MNLMNEQQQPGLGFGLGLGPWRPLEAPRAPAIQITAVGRHVGCSGVAELL